MSRLWKRRRYVGTHRVPRPPEMCDPWPDAPLLHEPIW